MFLLLGHEKYVIYSKLVNNPFNELSRQAFGFLLYSLQKEPTKTPDFFSPFVSDLCKNHEIGKRPPTPSVDNNNDFSNSITLLELVRASADKNYL